VNLENNCIFGKIIICPEKFLNIWKHFGNPPPPPPPLLSNLTHPLRQSARNGTEYTSFENRRGVIACMYFSYEKIIPDNFLAKESLIFSGM
jgi:hypothetical protein